MSDLTGVREITASAKPEDGNEIRAYVSGDVIRFGDRTNPHYQGAVNI